MRRLLLLLALSAAIAEVPIAGDSASRWVATPGWVKTPPTTSGVANDAGQLVFQAAGPVGSELPFVLRLTDQELNGDARYLVIRYRAEGLGTAPGNYFMHGWEGSPGGRTFLGSDEVAADGQWRTGAVDLVLLRPAEPVSQVAVKLLVGEGGAARLTVERIAFTDQLPADARVGRAAPPAVRASTILWPETMNAMTGWTPTPAAQHSYQRTGSVARFAIEEPARGMRWHRTLPEPVDLKALPLISFRYRARGPLGPRTYAIWLGTSATGSGGKSVVAVTPAPLVADGAWHHYSGKVEADWPATQLAVGLDSETGPVSLELDSLTFSNGPLPVTVAELLPYEKLEAPWPAGQEGFRTLAAEVTGGRPAGLLPARLGLSDWFAQGSIRACGVPFTVPASSASLRQTGTTELTSIELAAPPARELYLLLAVAAPASEPFGIDPRSPRPMTMLDVPEKATVELRYATGPPDEQLPVDVESGRWGFRRGLGVAVVHPDPRRELVAIRLHDRMQTASFALLAATGYTGQPRLAEPSWESLSYPTPPRHELAPDRFRAGIDTRQGLRWGGWESGLPEPLRVAGPIFSVVVGGKEWPSTAWSIDEQKATGTATEYRLSQPEAKLAGTLRVHREGTGLRLSFALTNTGSEALRATLRFPMVGQVAIGDSQQTWYLAGRRGGIINHVPFRMREALGEPHPLQCDGFFSPRAGLALACLTEDKEGLHHFITLSKDAQGGAWSAEYPDRDLAPGATFAASEANLRLLAGDWRAIFAAYQQWLAGWYKPPVDKPWWRHAFATVGTNAHFDAIADPRQRGSIQRVIDRTMQYLGRCDTVHLFGWSSSPRYGDWGDYDHYDETVGGLEYFRGNIAAAQAKGIAVSLYQDGFLSSEKGLFAGKRAREWAMKRPDGSPWYVPVYDAFNQCPALLGWQDYLSAAYGRIARETGAKALYVDEYGANDGRWTCYATDHGHNSVEIPFASEVAMLRRIREAVGPEIALYSEYPGAEIHRLYQDGSLTYQAIWSVDSEPLAPHFIDLPRFAFPDYKQLHLIHYVAVRAGNGWPLKFPFFNGETYRVGEPNLPSYDAAAMAFQKRAIEVLSDHREAFASRDVTPLVPTARPGVFANRFASASETVWTLYNANGRTVRGALLRVPHHAGARYQDAWQGLSLEPKIEADQAVIEVELGPKSVGCVVQQR
ncbi:MAG: hypothetical protein HUU35_00875 [Armatimonadetes bacterium]|nr:hypothetical protein [Armatimonadota bacterium]